MEDQMKQQEQEEQEERKCMLSEEDLAKVDGGLLCNIQGFCPMFKCKYCGSTMKFISQSCGGIKREWEKIGGCSHCDDNLKCKNCAFFRGGIKCAK